MAEQEKLLSDLKKLLVDPDSTKNARALLERLKKRPDVAVSVFNDIDLVLRGAPTSVDVNPPAIPRPMNLGFEGPVMNKMPVGWFNSAGYVAGVSLAYQTHLTSRPGGICVIFQNLKAADDEFGSLMQRCPAYHLAGKVIRFEGEISTRDVVDRAGLWLRADGEMLGMELFFDNMWRRPIRGTTDWKTYTIEAQLPPETAWLNYGILLEGPGMVLADNFRLQVWDKDHWVDL
jgi:hypothetical protein